MPITLRAAIWSASGRSASTGSGALRCTSGLATATPSTRAIRSRMSRPKGWLKLLVTVRSILPAVDSSDRVNASIMVGITPFRPKISITPNATARDVSAERSPRPRR